MVTFPSHAAGAYVVLQAAAIFVPELHLNQPQLVMTTMVAGMLPDIDVLFYLGNIQDHHNTPLHTPLFWIIFCLLLALVSKWFMPSIVVYALCLFLGVVSHLFLDWYAGRVAGIRIFYPFSKKRYALFPLERRTNLLSFKNFQSIKEYISFYLRNKILVFSEIIINIIALVFLISNK